MKTIISFYTLLTCAIMCVTASASPDKMADLGLTPDGKLLPTVKQTVVTDRLFIIQSSPEADAVVPIPIPDGYADANLHRKTEILMGALLDANKDRTASGVVLDKVNYGESKETIEVLFSVSQEIDLNRWAYGTGAHFLTMVNDVVLHNLVDVTGLQVKFRKGTTGDYQTLDEVIMTAEANGSPTVDMTPDGAELPADVLANQQKEDVSKRAPLNTFTGGSRPTGSLSGKAVYFNQGHGYTWRGNSDSWSIQRGNNLENVEDFSNADLINQYVLPYIWNTGADVFTVRESDYNPNMVIVDNDDADRTDGYGFSKTGTWTVSSVAAYKNGSAPYASGTNPFSLGTGLLTSCATSAQSATATWAAKIPATGWYNVYVSHIAWTNRNPSAKYQVYHAGGITDCTIDQRRWRNTWIPIGRFFFEQDAPAANAKVVLTNVGTSTSFYVSADAVRWGGGMGLIKRGNVGISGYSNYMEEARYHLQFTGMPADSTDSNGVRIGYNTGTLAETDRQCDENDGWYGRPRFARWMKDQATIYGAPAQDSSNLASHTNAFNGSARGFVTIRNDSSGYSDEASNTAYQDALHSVILADLQGIFNVSPGPIPQHSKPTGSYLEANPFYANMPNLLGEWLFHDNESDMALYHHPRFKQAMGRGIVRGIINFWADKGTTSRIYPPEPITNLCVLQESPSTVRLTWAIPPTAINGRTVASAATGYRIWMSEHGRAFPNALATITAPTTGAPTYQVTGLTPGKNYYFRITAINAGGESQPGDTLAVRTENASNAKKILIVQGFNKLDPATRVKTNYGGAVTYRQIPERMNSYDYIFEHMKGIDAYCKSSARPLKVDSCNKDSIVGTWVLLDNYDAVIWMSGIEAEVCTFDCWDDTALPANARTAITNYLNTNGKAFFISGSEVAWELKGKSVDGTFLNTTLKTDYASDSSGVYSVKPTAGSIFAGLDDAIAFDDGSDWVRPGYQVQWADVITPINGSVAALEYGAGTGTQLDSLDAQGNWKAPSYSGQTNAEASSISFDAVTKHEGAAAMKIDATWGAGTTIREYCSGTTYNAFTTGNAISYWVYGDNTNTKVALMIQDNDGDLLIHTPLELNFTGWRQYTWTYGDPYICWYKSGDGILTSPVRINSYLITTNATSPAAANTIRFDDIRITGGSVVTGAVAAVQYGTPETSRLVYMGFPFETILDENKRNSVMTRILDFLLPITDKGSLRVTITPESAVTAGAQWSIDNGATWNNSGVTVSGLPVGEYTVTFKPVGVELNPPADIQTVVTKDATAQVTGRYTTSSTPPVVPAGSGSASDPYRITVMGNLVWMGNAVSSSSGKYYKLMNTIDASASAEWNDGAGFVPIGNGTNAFAGIFDGNNMQITDLTINRPTSDRVGLFGDTVSATAIYNLGLVDCNLTGKNFIGALAGASRGTISHCYATGSVNGALDVGGLAGYIEGSISNCYTTCNVTGSGSYVGGLGGNKTSGVINNCYATGTVKGSSDYIGGFLGKNNSGNTNNCYSTGRVIGVGTFTGGFAGSNTGTINSCYYDSQTSGKSDKSRGTPKTTTEMKQKTTFEAWDFESVWFINNDVSYPTLLPAPITRTVDESGIVTFPLDATRNLTISGVTIGAVVTFQARNGHQFLAPNPPFRTPDTIYQESFSITATGIAGDMNATMVWQLDPTLVTGSTINKVFRVEGDNIAQEFAVTPDANVLTITGISGFSNWYAGSADDVPVTLSELNFE